MSKPPMTAAEEWRQGWTLALACLTGFGFFSVLLAATGVFIQPLTDEFGWSRSLLSSGPAIATGVTALLGPFYGALIDRYGSRRLALPGTILTALAVSVFGLANGSSTQWILFWVLFGLASTTIKSTIWTAAVAGTFFKGRGLAIGITVSGTALAQAVVPPLANTLIGAFGWRASFVWIAVGWGSISFLLSWLFLYDIHDRAAGRDRKGKASGEKAAPSGRVSLAGLSVGEAWRNSALWRVGIASFVVMLLTIGLGIHLFPILTEAGVTRSTAAWLTSLGGVAGIVGKLVTGVLLDRFRPNWVGGLTMGVTALTFGILIFAMNSLPLIVMAIIVNGYAAGTKTQIYSYLTAGYAGLKNFGKIYGMLSAMVALAAGLGPMVAGVIYDVAGGYGPFLAAGVLGCLLGGALLITLPAYPKWEQEPARA